MNPSLTKNEIVSADSFVLLRRFVDDGYDGVRRHVMFCSRKPVFVSLDKEKRTQEITWPDGLVV